MYMDKKICVIIPALNEEVLIGNVLDALPDFIDITVVVDDGSIDGTVDIAKSKGATVISHGKNRGVGAAFQTGLKETIKLGADIMVNIDADGQFNPGDIGKLVKPIIDNDAGFVTASRFKDPDYYPTMTKVKFYGNRLMSSLIAKIAGKKFYDVSCGFRAYSRETLLRINLFGEFTYTQETFLDLAFKNVSIVEVPIKVRGIREYGKSRVASNLFRYAYQTSKIILKTYRDYKPFTFFGFISALTFFLGFALGSFLFIYYLRTGAFTPHKWAGFTSAFFIVCSSLVFILGFILDMFARMRINQEEILFYLKSKNLR